MKRFLKIFAFLIVSLCLLISGVDAALDHLSHAMSENSLTLYNQKGNAVLVYHGDLVFCKVWAKPGLITEREFLHRT